MPAADLVVSSARVVTPAGEGPAAVVILQGTIAAIVPIDQAPMVRGHRVYDNGRCDERPGGQWVRRTITR